MAFTKKCYSLLKKTPYYIIGSGLFIDFARGQETGLIENPIRTQSFNDIVLTIADYLMRIGIPVAGIFIILSGFMFLTARGNEDKLKKAKTMLLWTIVGTAIVVGARIFAQIAVNFAQSL